MVKVFATDSGEWGSITGRVIPKTQKIVLDASLLISQHFKVWIKGMRSIPGKGEAPSITCRYCSY